MLQDKRHATLIATLAAGAAVVTWYSYGRGHGKKRSYVASLSETLNRPSPTLWLNLGFWAEGVASYPEAAEALAEAVAESAALGSLGPGAKIVDVGCGMGDSLRFWTQRYGAHPTSLGVNIDEAECREARLRGISQVFQGDATALPVEDGTMDAVIALDSAYHFNTRLDFLAEASRVLRPGGIFGAADIVSTNSSSVISHPWRCRIVCAIVGIPLANAHSAEQYESSLRSVGLSESVHLTDVTDFVTGEFAAGKWTDNLTVRAVAWLLGFLMRSGNLRFVIVGAAKAKDEGEIRQS